MNASKKPPTTDISKAADIEEIADYWDTHSLADHWDETEEVDFEVRAERRRCVTLDPTIYARLEVLARQGGILPETLVNILLKQPLGSTQG